MKETAGGDAVAEVRADLADRAGGYLDAKCCWADLRELLEYINPFMLLEGI